MRYRVLENYRPSYDYALILKPGTELQTVRRDEDNLEWVWCEPLSGGQNRENWVHVTFLEPEFSVPGTARAISHYSSLELLSTVGEEFTVVQKVGGWTQCRNARGEVGWVPDAILEPLE